jgi:hypothetical protein
MHVSLKHHLAVGALCGAAVGAAFALAVISMADCAGADCTWERINGLLGHAVLGSAIGACLGGIVFLGRRVLHRK